MIYVIKVGDFYVKSVDIYGEVVMSVQLSKDVMRGFSKKWAIIISKSLNAQMLEMSTEVTNE